MMKRQDFSRKIIKILMDKPAISFPEIVERIDAQNGSKYAINRSMRGLEEAGLIEHISSPQSQYARLTKEGKKKAHSIKLEGENTLVDTTWDGYWRIILLDLPEERKSEREALRYLLKKAGFICIKNSVWISMYPYEHLFTNIKKDLGLTTEMVIIVTDKIDKISEEIFLENLKK
ncbi:MAG: hypothetical protein AAB895_03850 [Patescibacteria group bacterium]